tara:strand:- start:53 stop:451 length:399 start_codon:yes stop_codon:yes gene_type:complete
MARKLTINERNILVDRAYSEIRTESISKLESEMQNNPKYLDIQACKQAIKDKNSEIDDMEVKIKKLNKTFNKELNSDYFEYTNEYNYHYNGNFKWNDKGLRNKIETEVVLANLGDSVDFEQLIASLKNQFGV